jgi:hypothetical protein
MTLSEIIMGCYDTDSERLSMMTDAEITERFKYTKSYISRVRNEIQSEETNRKAIELAKKYDDGQKWLDRTRQMIGMLESIEQGLADRGARP